MKPRSVWTGHIKISLLTIPIRVYTALNEADRITFNQLHKDCHQRLKQQLVCPVHGKVEREQVVKGYEVEKDRFVVMEASDIEAVKLETTHTIDLVQFIKSKELDPIYLDTPYFVGPDGPVSLEAYTVLREVLRKTNYLACSESPHRFLNDPLDFFRMLHFGGHHREGNVLLLDTEGFGRQIDEKETSC